MKDLHYTVGTNVFTVHNNEFRSSKIKRIIQDSDGTHYGLIIDGEMFERSKNQIAFTKEDLFNKMVDRYSSRQTK